MKYSDETIKSVCHAIGYRTEGVAFEIVHKAIAALESTDEQKALRADAERYRHITAHVSASEQPSNKRGNIELAHRLCFEIAGPTDEDDSDGRGYGSVDVAEILSAEIEALRGQVAETREMLAHTVMGSLPNDWPLRDVAEARLHDMIALQNQVRDTCVRAEQAEAILKKQEVEIVRLEMQVNCFYLGTPETRLLNTTKERDELRAKLADCQAVIRQRGHDADCPAVAVCAECGRREGDFNHHPRHPIFGPEHQFQPGPCSESCGHDRTAGEKA